MRPVAQIAQSVEQGIENPRVGGSIPSLGTKIPRNPKEQYVLGVFYCLRFNGRWTISGPGPQKLTEPSSERQTPSPPQTLIENRLRRSSESLNEEIKKEGQYSQPQNSAHISP